MILILEDLKSEAALIRLALAKAGVTAPTHHISDIGEAMQFISKHKQELRAILMDIRIKGRIETPYLIGELKRDVTTNKIPILMISVQPPSSLASELMAIHGIPFVLKESGPKLADSFRRFFQGEVKSTN